MPGRKNGRSGGGAGAGLASGDHVRWSIVRSARSSSGRAWRVVAALMLVRIAARAARPYSGRSTRNGRAATPAIGFAATAPELLSVIGRGGDTRPVSRETGGPTRRALAVAEVRNVVFGFHALTLGEWVLGTAVAIEAYGAGGALAVGLVGFRFAPAALATLVTADLGGRFGHGRVLMATASVRAVASLAAALTLVGGLPFALAVALVWIDAAAGSAYRPAQAGLLPHLVRTPGELTVLATLVSNAKSSGQALGAMAGGVLTGVVSAPGAVVVAAGLYAGSALAATSSVRAERAPAGPSERGWRHHIAGIVSGFRTLAREATTVRIAGWSCVRSLIRGLWVSLGVVAALTILDMGPSGFGLLLGAAGAGTAIGVLLTGRLAGRALLSGPFAVGLLLCSLPVAAIGLSASAAPALALMVGWGVGMSLSDVGASALLNRVVAPSELARVVAAMEAAKLLAEALGCILAPALVALVGVREALLYCGLAVALAVLADRRGFRAIDRRAVGQVELLELARGVPLFAPLNVDGLEAVVAPLIRVEATAGTDVVQQDSFGTRWYLVAGGELEVLVAGFVVGRAARGDSFGERGLLRDEPRSATVRAITDASLLALERADFLRAVMLTEDSAPDSMLGAPRDRVEALGRQHALAAVDSGALAELASSAEDLSLAPGEVLFAEDDRDDRYCVVLDGEIEIRVDGNLRRVMAAGDGFGEIAVLHRMPRTASAIARTRARVLAVNGERLRQLPAIHAIVATAAGAEADRSSSTHAPSTRSEE